MQCRRGWATISGTSRGSVIVLALVALVVAGASAAGETRPALRVAGTDPVTVRGSGFRASERVRVTLETTGFKRAQQTRTTTAGTFRASFDLPGAVDLCNSGLVVTAHGGEGDAATAKVVPRACPPA